MDVNNVKDTKDETDEDSSKVNLSFSEVLYLLSRQAVLGPGIPAKYDVPPWRLPSSHPHHHQVNMIVERSMMVQSAHIPNTDNDFQQFILSNASLAVSGLLKYYLSSLQITSELIFGVLLWDEAARSGPDDFEGTPHVWLNLENDIPIDNNYVAFPPNADNLEYFYECKKMNAYCKEDPLQTSLKLYLGLDEDAEAKEVVRHNLRIMQIYSKSSNIMKYLAISLKHAELNPGVKMYHILMQDWLKSTLGLSVDDLELRMSRVCWSCDVEADPATFKTCTECKVAKYCNRECQRQEWKVHRLLHKEIEHTKNILEKVV